MTSLGDEKLSKKDLEMMVKEADSDNNGLVNCQGQANLTFSLLSNYCMVLYFLFIQVQTIKIGNNFRILRNSLQQWTKQKWGKEEKPRNQEK